MIDFRHLLPLLLLSAPVPAAFSSAAEGPFQNLSFERALENADATGKVVMVDFYTAWAGPCRRLEETTWKDDDVREWLVQHTVALRVDAELKTDLAKRYSIENYPTLLFVDPRGQVLDRIVGYRNPNRFLAEARSALAGKKPVELARKAYEENPREPRRRMDYAAALTEVGEHELALEHFLWCFDHGLRIDRTFAELRSTVLLEEFGRLARAYPAAHELLSSRRDELGRDLLEGAHDDALLPDFQRLNEVLGEPEHGLVLFDELGECGDAEAFALRDPLAALMPGQLVESRRYEQYLAVFPDPLEDVLRQFDVRARSARAVEKARPQDARRLELELRDETERLHDVAGWSFEVLVASRRPEPARRLAEAWIELEPRDATFARLIGHALRAGSTELALELAEGAKKALPEDRRSASMRAASAIPAR